MSEQWAQTAKSVLVLVILFAIFALVAQIVFGQIGSIAQTFPIENTNPFYGAYSSLNTALTNAMASLAPVFQLIVAIIVISLIFVLIRVIA
jgi:type III secretory pathway component EscU